MLKISEQSRGALEVRARPGYVERLRVQLSEDYPHFLPRFPDDIGRRIVANMLSRASLWGLSRQRAFTIWCGWMIAIAPNFDDEPEIRAALEALPVPRDQGLSRLTSGAVSSLAWERAEAQSSILPLFVTPDLSQSPPEQQIAAALPIVLFGLPQADDPMPITRQAIVAAATMGLAHYPDAPLVVASCLAHWGPDWARLPWAAQLQRDGIQGTELLAALRFRLALEFGRYM